MKKIMSFAALFLVFFISSAMAQFEGKVVYHLYEIEDGERSDEETITVFITPQRILLQSEDAYKMGGSFKTEGLLIRMDKKDFVFLTGEKTAMKITKAGITSFINMFASAENMDKEAPEMNFTFENTGETQTIDGYSAEKFVLITEEEPDKKNIIWMTQDIDINWGMLAEPWGNTASFFTEKDLPTDYIFQKGYLPLKIEQYENESLISVAEADVTTDDMAQTMVQLSPEITVTSLSEYMFQMMRQKQQ